MRRWPSILLATVLTLTLAAPAAAIDPVPAEGHPYSVGDELHYHWGYPLDPSGSKWNPPDYAREAIESATLLHANTSTKARAPEFIKGGSGGERGEFWWAWQSVSPCTSNQLACAGHQVPANNSYYSEHASPKPTWRVTLSPQGDNCGATCRINWCENPDVDNSNCWYMKRVLIHELGHVLDLAHDPTHSEGTSVMYEDVPPYADPDGGDTKEYLSCDVARLQLLYSRDATDRAPSTCLRDIPHTTDDMLETVLTIDADDTVACFGQSVTFSGKLSFEAWDSYESLANDPIGGQTIIIQYRPWGSTGSWTDDLTLTTDDGGHWSAVHRFYTSVDREWRAKSLDETMIQHDYSSSIRVRWPAPC
jgi:hypothetical protein